jgi:hypothetical protein
VNPTTHILLTRFNVRVRAKWSHASADPAWLLNRFDLFEQFCLPSVRSQTAPDFRWLIYFDAMTSEEHLDRARTALADLPQARIVLIDAFDRELWLPPIHESIPLGASRVITTRLDNDDALHPHFLSAVQAAALRSEMPCFLNLSKGYTLRDGHLHLVHDRSNAFLSLVEHTAAPETVWVKPHTEASTFAPVQQVSAPPAWLQVIHGENVSNRVRGRRVDARRLHEFGFPAPGDESTLAILADNLSRYPARLARDAAVGVARRLRRFAR